MLPFYSKIIMSHSLLITSFLFAMQKVKINCQCSYLHGIFRLFKMSVALRIKRYIL